MLVVLHDETLDRTACPTEESSPGDCTGLVRTKTLAQIKTCEVGSWFNETYPQYAKPGYVGLEIPTLEQVFKRYGKSTNYYIETKSPAAAVMEEELLRLMGKYDRLKPTKHWRVLIQSFSLDHLPKIHASAPRLPLIRLYTRSDSQTIQATLDAARTYAVGIGPAKDNVDASLVAAAHNCCLDIHPYTVSEKVGCRTSSPSGWTALFTNFPMRLDEVLGRNAVGNDIEAGNRATRNSEACRKGTRGSAN